MKTLRFATALLLALVAAPAAAEDLVRLNTFPTARSLPFFVGVEKGLFAKHGIKLEFEFTESSSAQRQGLANGKFEVVHSAVDNALAMIEVAKVDVVIVSGGDGGTNEFIVGRGINSFADIRGKALVTDAPNTAYALQAKKILLRNGLKDGVDYRINAVGAGPFRLKARSYCAPGPGPIPRFSNAISRAMSNRCAGCWTRPTATRPLRC
jgi:ABC-type nitrate/sulfonate/bicarbonate transport system substrate-binding protein